VGRVDGLRVVRVGVRVLVGRVDGLCVVRVGVRVSGGSGGRIVM